MSYSAGLNILEPQVINRERIQDLINSFSSIGASENGSVSRRGFSDEDIYARNFFMKTLKDLGLKIRIDTAGNIIARLDGHDNNLPPIVTGSHLDTVPKGGKYDGTLGVIAGIEIAFFLQENIPWKSIVRLASAFRVRAFFVRRIALKSKTICLGSAFLAGAFFFGKIALTKSKAIRLGSAFVAESSALEKIPRKNAHGSS